MDEKKIIYVTEEKGFPAGFGYNCTTIKPVEVKSEKSNNDLHPNCETKE